MPLVLLSPCTSLTSNGAKSFADETILCGVSSNLKKKRKKNECRVPETGNCESTRPGKRYQTHQERKKFVCTLGHMHRVLQEGRKKGSAAPAVDLAVMTSSKYAY